MSELHYIISASIGRNLPIYSVNLSLLAFSPKEATVTFFEICPHLSWDSNSSKPVCQGCTILSPPALGVPCLFILLIFPCSHLLPRKLQWLFLKFSPSCHVTRIPRNRYVRAAVCYVRQHCRFHCSL